MCFSPTASFTASAVLGPAGIASLKKANKNERPLALIPLLFAIQQFFEGVVWVTFGHEVIQKIAAFFFLLFAEVLWPVYIPLASFLMEKNAKKKKILKFFVIMGILMGLFLLFANIFLHDLQPTIAGGSIEYGLSKFRGHFHLDNEVLSGLYMLIIVGGGLVSSNRGMNLFTFLVLIAAAATNHLYRITFVSVWCLFAAVISFIIYLYICHRKDKRFAFLLPTGLK